MASVVRSSIFPIVACLTWAYGASNRAWADDSNRHRTPLSSEAILAGDALVASIRSSGAVWYNPAGLGGLERSSARMTLSAYALRFRRVDDAIVVELPDDRREGFDLSSRDWSIAPSVTVLGLRLGPRIGFALSVLTPTFDESDLDEFGSASGETFSFVQQTKLVSRTKRYHIGASVGWAVRDDLRVGASVFFVYEKDVLSGRIWAASDLRDLDVREFGSSDFFSQTRRYGGQVDLGVQWDLTRSISLGFMVRTPRFQVVQTVSGSSLSTLVAEFDGQSFGEFDYQDEVEEQTPPKTEPVQLVWGAAWRWDAGEIAIQADVSPPQDGDGEQARDLVVDLAANLRVQVHDAFEAGEGSSPTRALIRG